MIRLCTGLRPITGSRFYRPCPRQVMTALGRCSACRPQPERAPVDPEAQARWNRTHREKVARERAAAGLSSATEAT